MKRSLFLVLPVVFSVSCSDKVEPQDVTDRTNTAVTEVLSTSGSALTSLSSTEAFSAFGNALDAMNLAFASVPSITPATGGSEPAPSPSMFASARLFWTAIAPPSRYQRQAMTEAEGESGDDLEAAAQAIGEWLETEVFIEANLEEATATMAIFRVPPSAVCPTEAECGASCFDAACIASCASEVQDCTEAITKIQPRIRATLVDPDGVDLALMIGPSRFIPFELQLRPDSIATEIDLAAVKASAVFIVTELGGDATDVPDTFEGRLRFAIIVHGEEDVEITFGILQTVRIANDGISISAQASNPLASLRADGIAKTLTLLLDAGALDVTAPYAEVTGNPLSTGTFSVHIDGASYLVELAEGSNVLTVENIGVGDATTTVKKDDVVLFALDLNATAGRHFTMTIEPDVATGSALFTFAPTFDLLLDFYIQAVANDFPDVEPYFLDDTYRIAASGNGSAKLLPVPANLLTGFDGGIKVVAGELRLEATSNSGQPNASVVVPEGQCLVGLATPATGSHPILGYFAVDANCQ